MDITDIPSQFPIPFAASAGPTTERSVPQTTTTPGAASLDLGFPEANFEQTTAGGIPMDGRDMNGILKLLSLWSQYVGAGGTPTFDGTQAAAIGGYAQGAILASATTAGVLWLCTSDNNSNDPDVGGSGWVSILSTASPGIVPPGAMIEYGGVTAPTGYLMCFGQSLLRTDFPALFGAIGTTWGSVDGTHFSLPDCRGNVGAGADAMGGTPANRLTSTTITGGASVGHSGGEQTHVLVTAELAQHSHAISDPGHSHGVTDPGHVHGVSDPGHSHGVTDPGHSHSIPATISTGGSTDGAVTSFGATLGVTHSQAAFTGISIQGNTTGVSIQSHTTGVSINGAATGITGTNNTGSNNAHNNVQPTYVALKIIKT